MAILKKRTSNKQIPDAGALDRAPLNSIIQGLNKKPNISNPKNTVTSTTKPTTTTTPKTPAITTKTPDTKTSITTPTSGITKPKLTNTTAKTNTATNKVLTALAGAGLGLGTKAIVDKINKPTTTKPVTSVTKKPAVSSGKAPTVPTKKPPVVDIPKVPTKPTTPPKVPTKPTTPTAPVDKGQTFPLKDDTEVEYTTDSLGNVFKVMPDGTYELYRAAEVDESPEPNEDLTDSDSTVDEQIDALPEQPTYDSQYFQDEDGNIYTMDSNGDYILYANADGSLPDETVYDETNPFENNTWIDEETGAVWEADADGNWSTNFDYDDYWNSLTQDQPLPDEIDYIDYGDNSDYTDYGSYDYGDYNWKRGGLITMMKKGGVANYVGGGYVDNEDGTFSGYDSNGDYVTVDDMGYEISREVQDKYVGQTFDTSDMVKRDTPVAMATNTAADDDSSDFVTEIENPAEEGDEGYGWRYFSDGTVISPSGQYYQGDELIYDPIQSAGGGERSWYDKLGSTLSQGAGTVSKLGSEALSGITGALGTTAGAAGAGALIATLLGQDFSGGTGAQNQGLDMSKVGLINPRTTDFGIGPTRYVGYEDYGTDLGEYTPNEELLRNLNAPGYNPVNEGDYGYEPVDETETTTPKMASGGLSSMATPVSSYYTFGQPADILANLGMRPQPPMNSPDMMTQVGQQKPPEQAQQQGLPQQMPPQMMQQNPQGMPQQGMMPQQQGMPPPMRKGGLPHVSNVPMVGGRMDFRNGSAVHGEGDGQSDDIPAMLADGEYVIDAETVAQIGNGSTKAGAQVLDKFREGIRAHKRSAPLNKIPPKTKALTSYLKGAK
jgi:hypothetical protein